MGQQLKTIEEQKVEFRSGNWLADLTPHVVSLAREAGQAIMKVYAEMEPVVELKADKSPLTHADLASHHIILSGLARLSPDWPVLSEESAEVPFDRRRSWPYFWMVDPLDGTKEFLNRSGEFTVNIALIEGNAPILGVVFAPALGRMYFAARNLGSHRIDGEVVTQIRTQPAMNGTVRAMVSRSHRGPDENLERYTGGAEKCEFIEMGSSLKFCLIAEGGADLYPRVGPTMEWDTAAAQCILEQAGGLVTDLEGNPMIYNKPQLLNPGFLAKGSSYSITTASRP
jgi:3'(2'), 5'-bisphosphate nucleotidase